MFQHHKEKKALEEYQVELAHWQSLRDGYAEMVQLAQGPGRIRLERDHAAVRRARSRQSHQTRASSRIGEDGRLLGWIAWRLDPRGLPRWPDVRYRVGQPPAVITCRASRCRRPSTRATVFITNKRVIFQGAKQTRECLFAKLIGVEHDDAAGSTVISVSNRQKPTTIHYGPNIAGWFDFRMDFALAQFKQTVPQLVQSLQTELTGSSSPSPSSRRSPRRESHRAHLSMYQRAPIEVTSSEFEESVAECYWRSSSRSNGGPDPSGHGRTPVLGSALPSRASRNLLFHATAFRVSLRRGLGRRRTSRRNQAPPTAVGTRRRLRG